MSEEKLAIIKFLDREAGHITVSVPVENLKNLISDGSLIIRYPSGERVESIEDVKSGDTILVVPPVEGG